jgi:hypothetical protein
MLNIAICKPNKVIAYLAKSCSRQLKDPGYQSRSSLNQQFNIQNNLCRFWDRKKPLA